MTALLVRGDDGREHLNAFAFLHGRAKLPRTPDGYPDISCVADFEPGRCVREDTDVRPGGNAVLGYLDVVCPDDAPDRSVLVALDKLKYAIARGTGPWTVVEGGVATRLGMVFGVEDNGRLAAVFASLRDRIDRILKARSTFASEPLGPLLIWLRTLPGGLELSLPASTQARLPRSAARTARFLLPSDVALHFSGGARAALIEGGYALLGRGAKQVRSDGGMRFIDPESGAERFSAGVDEPVPTPPRAKARRMAKKRKGGRMTAAKWRVATSSGSKGPVKSRRRERRP